jgi:hypothetical protein
LLASTNPSRLVLLRETALDSSCINHGDIDLFGTESATEQLIERAFELVRDGRCHMRVVRTNPDKIQLQLYSLDLKRRILFDLWINLWQLEGGTRCIRLDDVAEHVPDDAAIARMPVELEASLYIQHLVAKNRNLGMTEVRRRLGFYELACRESGLSALADVLASICRSGVILPEQLSQSADTIRRATSEAPWRLHPRRRRSRLRRRLRARAMLNATSRVVAVVGSDGVGKTSIANGVADGTGQFSVLVGKQLYRGTLLFRGLYRLNSLTLKWTQERIDEAFAPIAFGLSCLRLRVLLRWRRWTRKRGVLILDRFLPDFLYVKRKTDRPKFARLARWLLPFGVQASVVHLLLPYESLQERKQEFTREGHARYDEDMMRTYCGADLCDYLAFHNDGEIKEVVEALRGHILRESGESR